MAIPNLVLDTNVLLVSVPVQSRYHWIFKLILEEKADFYITNEILLEYREVLSRKFSAELADAVSEVLIAAPRVHPVVPYYHWNLVKDDPDDDKFVDCAVVSNGIIVTEDRHFDILKDIGFPRVPVIRISELQNLSQND